MYQCADEKMTIKTDNAVTSSLLFFFANLLHEKPKHTSLNKRLVLIPYCNITSWFAIALAEIDKN